MNRQKPKYNCVFMGLMLLPLAMITLLFWLSHHSSLPINPPFEHFDKLAHFGAYFALCGSWLLALSWRHPPLKTSTLVRLALLLTVGYGVLDEIHQAFVPGRFASLADWFMDALGAIAAAELGRRFAPKCLFPGLQRKSIL